MILDFLEVDNFRNLSGKIFWGPGLNIIHGNNGQGKTNWLEAIHTPLQNKILSHATSSGINQVWRGQRFSRRTGFSGEDLQRDLRITLKENTKSIGVNGKREPLARYLGQLQVFSFTADQLEVVRGMPEARRHFIDRGVASLRPAYVHTVSDYNQVIKQKNRILQDDLERELQPGGNCKICSRPGTNNWLRLAAEIHEARVDYTERLNS